jgi:hypothetical protein
MSNDFKIGDRVHSTSWWNTSGEKADLGCAGTVIDILGDKIIVNWRINYRTTRSADSLVNLRTLLKKNKIDSIEHIQMGGL